MFALNYWRLTDWLKVSSLQVVTALTTLLVFYVLSLKSTAISFGFNDPWYGFQERPLWAIFFLVETVSLFFFLKSKKDEVQLSMIGNIFSISVLSSLYSFFVWNNQAMAVSIATVSIGIALCFFLYTPSFFRGGWKTALSVFLIHPTVMFLGLLFLLSYTDIPTQHLL